MKIACIGWGSLIWKPENLQIEQKWFQDGPFLPVEFARQSQNGRITLVITEGAQPIKTLWALMTVKNLDSAIESLRTREDIGLRNIHFIASISTEKEPKDPIGKIIKSWLLQMNLDAAVWTNLPPKFGGENKTPSIEEIITYINTIDKDKLDLVKEYITKAPQQVVTLYRRQLENEFKWTSS